MKKSLFISITISLISINLVGQNDFNFPKSLIIRFDATLKKMDYTEIWFHNKSKDSTLGSRGYYFNKSGCPLFYCIYYSLTDSVGENHYDYLINKKTLQKQILLNGEDINENLKKIRNNIDNIFIYDINNQKYKKKVVLRKVQVRFCPDE